MKRSLYILLFIFGIISQISFAQTWQWSTQIGSIDTEGLKKIITDKNNSVYIAGSYLGPYCYFENDTVGCNGYLDFYVAKYNSSGIEQWVKRFGGFNSGMAQEFSSLAYDSVNNYIYLAGSFMGTCLFDSIILTATGNDGFVAKYDVNGNCLWAKRCGGHGTTIVADVGVDQSGNICIVGMSTDAVTFDTITIATGVFLAKYDSSGNCLWAKKKFNRIPNPVWLYEIEPYSLQTYQNDIFIGGACYVDTLSVDSILLTAARKISMVLARFDSVGTAKWVITGGGPLASGAFSIIVDKTGYIYMTGSFSGDVIFEDDTLHHLVLKRDFFLAKYNPAGQLDWVRQCHDSSGADGYSVCTDRDSGVYVTGQIFGTAYFGDYIISAGTPVDLFIAKYSSSGDCVGAINNGGSAGFCISTDYNNDVISAGRFSNTVTFGSNPSMTSYGADDIYLVKSDAITGIGEERMANNELLIYANPTSGTCNVTIPDEFLNEKNLTLSVYDNTGKLIQQGRIELNEDKVRVNLEAEAKGIYNVTLSNGKKSYGGKIVFE